MQLRILWVHSKTSSLWVEFVNKNRCISVLLVSEEVKSIKFDNFDNSHNSFLWPEYFINFLCEKWIPCQASTCVLCLHYRPETVHCRTKDAYTFEITFFPLRLWTEPLNQRDIWAKSSIIKKITSNCRKLSKLLILKLNYTQKNLISNWENWIFYYLVTLRIFR